MSYLYKRLVRDKEFDLQLLVSGAHLSPTYGYSVEQIQKDGLHILAKIECLIDSNTRASRLKSAAILLQTCIDTVAQFAPDLIIYHGDREEIIIGALLATYLRIPSIHFFGGDHSPDGNIDNPIRHAASKMASYHFVRERDHVERLVKLGEAKDRIHYVGDPSGDKFNEEAWLAKEQVMNHLGRTQWQKYALMIHHPIAGEEALAGEYFEQILKALIQTKTCAFISYPNVDAGNKAIIDVIQKYSENTQFCFYKNLGREVFVNLMRHASFMIGNSSAGLFEAPCIGLPVINVGERQLGRKQVSGVHFVKQELNAILKAIEGLEFSERQVPDNTMSFAETSYRLIKTLDFNAKVAKTEDPLKL